MDLIARCPACQTSYRVVPDQLRVSDGWVRCGQCGEIFDASLQLVDAMTEPSAKDVCVPDDGPVRASPWTQDTPLSVAPQCTTYDDIAADQQNAPEPLDDIQARQVAPEAAELSWTSAALLVRPSSESELAVDVEEITEPTPLPSEAPVSFMLAPAGSSGELPRSRPALWWGLGTLLLCGLLFQGTYHERDRLAAFSPELRPAMQAFCDVLDCRISPARRIDELVIDSAEFRQVAQESFELRFVIKNKSRLDLAMPAIELTLTDMTDRAVTRRVFTPVELGEAEAGTVAAAGVWSVLVYVRVSAEAVGVRALGYRLLVFYP